MRVVEGQLYSARSVNRSRDRVKRLGFFEDVEFEAKPTDYQEQLDLEAKVVERPTGSLSFGVGYSTQDALVVSGSVSQSNLFGRGYGVQAVVDYGSRNSQFYLSFYDPYLFGSEFSLRSTLFRTDLEYIDFQQLETGVDVLARPRPERGRHRARQPPLQLRVAGHQPPHHRERRGDDLPRAALEREQHQPARPLLGLRHARRRRRAEERARVRRQRSSSRASAASRSSFASKGAALWFVQPPDWFPTWFPFRDDSTFVFGVRAGYTLPFNSISDYSFDVPQVPTGPGSEVQPLNNIDTDLELPLSERYFLGGLGSYQLRGYRARSVGPRRAAPAAHRRLRPRQLLHAGRTHRRLLPGRRRPDPGLVLRRLEERASGTRATATASATACTTRRPATSRTSKRPT